MHSESIAHDSAECTRSVWFDQPPRINYRISFRYSELITLFHPKSTQVIPMIDEHSDATSTANLLATARLAGASPASKPAVPGLSRLVNEREQSWTNGSRAVIPRRYGRRADDLLRDPTAILTLLVVDDDPPVLKACSEIAAGMGFKVHSSSTADEARAYVLSHAPDVVLMDLKMPAGGLSLLEDIRKRRPRSSVVVMTAFATVTSAVEAMRIGATDYLTKPFAMDELTSVLERAGQRRSYELESKRIQAHLQMHGDGLMIGTSPEMEKIVRIVQKVAPANHPVLILGESGTGKEMVARAVHTSGPHASRRFTMLDCGHLAPAVLEAELFGYGLGPNTAFKNAKRGALVSEEGGTLFLDSIGDMPLDLQGKLVRALQEKQIIPPGSDVPLPVTVRVLAASTRNLSALVDQGIFRKDLYYRLNVVTLRIPPLRERRQDIPVLAEYFLQRMRRESAVTHQFAPATMQVMLDYDWPGNVRELESAIERACSLSSGPVLHVSDLPTQLQGAVLSQQMAGDTLLRVDERNLPMRPVEGNALRSSPAIVSISELEREAILHTIRQLHGDKLMAAKLLGIGKTTLYRKLKEYGISDT